MVNKFKIFLKILLSFLILNNFNYAYSATYNTQTLSGTAYNTSTTHVLNGTLTLINNSGTRQQYGNLSGSGILRWNSSGTLQHPGSNSISIAGYTVEQGQVSFFSNVNLTGDTLLTINGSGTIRVGSGDKSFDGVTGSGNLRIDDSATLTLEPEAGESNTFSGNFTNSTSNGNITIDGAGTQIFNRTTNVDTVLGVIRITEGVLGATGNVLMGNSPTDGPGNDAEERIIFTSNSNSKQLYNPDTNATTIARELRFNGDATDNITLGLDGSAAMTFSDTASVNDDLEINVLSDVTFSSGIELFNDDEAAYVGFDVANGVTLDVSGNILRADNAAAGTQAGIDKKGSGTMEMTGTNTFTGITRISDGTLIVDDDRSFGAAPGSLTTNIILNGGTLETNSAVTLDSNRRIEVAADSTITRNTGGKFTINSPIIGSSNLTKSGTNEVELASSTASGFSGTLTVNAGTFRISTNMSGNPDYNVATL